MAGTSEGGRKAAITNRQRYNKYFPDQPNGFYGAIGSLGGKVSRGGGFQRDSETAREAGRKGGLASKRGPAVKLD